MPGVDKFVLPDLVIWVGAQTAEAGNRIAAELGKIIQSGRAGTRKSAGFILLPVMLEDVIASMRHRLAGGAGVVENSCSLEDLTVFITVMFRGSAKKAGWVMGNLQREMGAGKVDEYFRQFKAGWSSEPLADAAAKQFLDRELARAQAAQQPSA